MYFPGVGLVWVRWFIVAEGTKPLDKPTVYNSRNWRISQGWEPGIPGEVMGAKRPWVRNERPELECDGPKGSAAAWLGGETELFLCHGIPQWTGGIEFDGCWPHRILDSWTAEGGSESSGAGTWGVGWLGTGGSESNGLGMWAVGWPGTGGSESSGAGTWGVGWLGTGGSESNGAGEWSTSVVGSGGSEGNGEGTFDSESLLGSGGGESDGSGLWGAPTPGSTCATGPTLSLPFSGSYTIPAMADHWFNFVPTSGVQYHVRISGVSGGATATADVRKGTCGSMSALFVYILPGCNAAVAGSEAFWLIRIVGDPAAPTNYTLEVATGPC